MSAYDLTPFAKADVLSIWRYIALDNEAAADRVKEAIREACKFVAESPMRGHTRRELTTRDLRFWTLTKYPNYCLVYRPDTSPLQVIAVLHGRRNLLRILADRA